MNPFTKGLLTAREALINEITKQTAKLQQQVSHIDDLLKQYGEDAAELVETDASPEIAPPKRRGRPPGKTAKKGKPGRKPGRKPKIVAEENGETPAEPKKRRGRAAKSGFNTTGTVRAIVADMAKPFTIKELREEFERRHPGVLGSLNRIALSLAMQSLGRKGEVSAKKDPNGKGNLFSRTAKLKV